MEYSKGSAKKKVCNYECLRQKYREIKKNILRQIKMEIKSIKTYRKTKQNKTKKKIDVARCQWLPPVILANQAAEIRRMTVQSQPW
jgi:hypothetical protein